MPSYKGANNWKICQLVPKTGEDEKGARHSIQCILNALEARMSLLIREGKVGAISTADEAAMGYYLVKWLSEPYALQEDMLDGMSGTIGAEMMVVNIIYFNRVERAPHWYTQSGKTTVAEVRYVLQTGLHLQPISATNKLPMECQRWVATQKKAVKVTFQDHEAIMEEASKYDRLVVGRLVMYRTSVLMYRTIVLLARPTKVRR